jgi:hypothetical protein
MGHEERHPGRNGRHLPALRGESGAVLPTVMVLATTTLIVVLSVFQFSALDAGLAAHHIRRAQALYLAEGCLQQGQTWLEAQPEPPAGADTLYPSGFVPYQFASGTVLYWIVPRTGVDGGFTIVSEATVGTHTRRLEADVSAGVFTDFLYFTDREHMPGSGNPLWFATGDVVDGPLFTNDQVSIFGDPRFLSAVASAYGGSGDCNQNHNAAFYYHNGSGTPIESTADSNAPHDSPYFADGYTLGSEWIDYPTNPVVFDFREDARGGGINLSGNYEVVFARPDPTTGVPMYGCVSYRKSTRAWTDTSISSTNGIMFVNGSVSVKGTVDGQMTVVTNGAITITDDICYRASDANGPLPGCEDMLGLVAGGDIIVANNAANNSDCVIHAAMMALSNSLRVDNWNTGSPRGSLTVWGSIIQDFRGSIGTAQLVDGQVVVLTGYAKDYHYDWRLQDEYPPGFYRFLKTGAFKRTAWREIPQDDLGYAPTRHSG